MGHLPYGGCPKESKFILRLFYKMEIELNNENPFKGELLNSYFNEFLIRFSRSVYSDTPQINLSTGERKRFQNIRKKVLSTLEHNWTVEEMGKLASLSPSRFHTVYKAVFGISPVKDIIDNRIQTAQNMLLSTELSVGEISEKLGYLNTNHFIRQFKALVHQTPLAYRKNHS